VQHRHRPGPNLAAWDDLVEFAQDHGMNHETLVGFTRVLCNVMVRLTGGAVPRHRNCRDKKRI